MKKILMMAAIILAGFTASAQTVDAVPVGYNGVDQVLVEKVTPSTAAIAAGVPSDAVTYRLFVDMEPGFKWIGFGGDDSPVVEMYVRSSQPFYNNSLVGSQKGSSANPALYAGFADLQYDSYLSDSRIGGSEIGVLYADDSDGTLNGISAGTAPEVGLAIPLEGDWLIGLNNTATELAGSQYGWGAKASGYGTQNIVFIGQFTTSGDFEFAGLISVSDPTATLRMTNLITYPLAANDPPSIAWLVPPDGSVIGKGINTVLAVYAEDPEGAIASVEFFQNGMSMGLGTFNGNTTDPTQPNYIFPWTVLGSFEDFYAEVTDDASQTAQSATITIEVEDTNPTYVTMTAPAAGTYNLNAITLAATASDGDSPITGVDFLVGGALVGAGVNTSGDTWELAGYMPSAATVNIVARATNNDLEVVTSNPVSVTFENAVPTLSYITPASFPYTLPVGNVLPVEVNASDADGSITKVDFYINGTLLGTDSDATGGWTMNYSTGATSTVVLSARATDNLGAQVTLVGGQIVNQYTGSSYLLESVTAFCSESDVFCMPVLTPGAVSGVTGYDIELKYDASKVTPTGVILVAEELITDRDWVDYNYNVVGDTMIRASIYFNTTAPLGTTWTGNGKVFCVEFSRNWNFPVEGSSNFILSLVSVSNAIGVSDIVGSTVSTYNTVKETSFAGSLTFWSDNSPIAYVPGTNLVTDIFGDLDAGHSNGVQPDANGVFAYDIANGTSIEILRDADAGYDVQSIISSYDAFLASKVAVEDEGYRPNVYQIIAMDVNSDGRIAAGDLTDISQRSVGNLDEFVGGDWVWVAKTTVLTNTTYRISADYPLDDLSGYSRKAVPQPVSVHPLPILDPTGCPVIETEEFKGILLGDVTGNYAAAVSNPIFKSAVAGDTGIELIVSGTTVEVYVKNGNAVDMQLKAANALKVKTSYNGATNITRDIVKMSLYTNSAAFNSSRVATIEFSETVSSDEIEVLLSNINEEYTEVKITNGVTGIEDNIFSGARVFPNPSTNLINVEFEGVASVALVNMAGQVLELQEEVQGKTMFDVSELAAGSYMIYVGVSPYHVVVVK